MRISVFFILIGLGITSLKAQTVDAAGKKQGYWKKKDEKTGKLIYEGEFKDNLPVGTFKYYYPHDTLQAIMKFSQGGKVAYAQLFHPNGKRMGTGKYVTEQKDSIWTFFDAMGVLISKDNYKMGKKHGVCYVYLPEGILSEERNYKDGLEHGTFKQYFDGKKLKGQGNYVNGNLDGKCTYWYPNGIEAAVGYYKDGKKEGPWIYKEKDGKIKSKELYRGGKEATKKETEEFFNKSKANAVPGNSSTGKQKTQTGTKNGK